MNLLLASISTGLTSRLRSLGRRLRSAVLMLAGILLAHHSFGATFTWNGGGANGNWSTPGNWSSGTAPTATGNNFVFGGTTNLSAVNDVVTATDTAFANTALTFASGAGSFTLSGNALTIGSGGGAGQVFVQQNSTSAQTISLNVNLSGGSGDRSIVFASGAGSLTLSGNINFSNDWLFPNATAGTLILSGANSGDGKAPTAGGITAGTNTMNAMMRNNVAGTNLVLGSDFALGNSGSGSAAAGTASLRGVVANQQVKVSTTNAEKILTGKAVDAIAHNNTYTGTSNLTIGNIYAVISNLDFIAPTTGRVTF
ncbi:hypothetical protein CfE428DRAFT_5729 [Chthoniobacter flavus Ellin428]|uniref:Autotransporter-associated beta strand repeat protein n=1 Tax=Chthoniobacter flavus Ellin428 TaxID=497964 RepID=B4D9V2_9BACT|nr:hypothetical protein [Chthoniobacter flavus]EDY16766.1 hypothetical protein CfE428DRAFT_5729 [Chthoniobacter flavus Ellin428]